MALMHRALPLPIHAPTPPDRYLCHRLPGAQRINPLDCQHAVDINWPSTHTYLPYFLSEPRPSTAESIPSYAYLGSCRVALEAAGPQGHLPPTMLLRPSEIRGLAGYLIQKCPVERDGVGGFLTLGFTRAYSWIHDPRNETLGGNFITISVEPRAHLGVTVVEPGNRDANIPVWLAQHAAGLGRALGTYGAQWWYDAIAVNLHNRALEMVGGYRYDLTWWGKNGRVSWWATTIGRPGSVSSSWMASNWRPTITNSSQSNGEGRETVQGGERGRGRNESTTDTLSPPGSDDGNHDDDYDDDYDRNPVPVADASSSTVSLDEIVDENNTGENQGQGRKTSDEAESHNIRKNFDVGDMTYQCDDSLGGGPTPVDCDKLSWSGLKPPDSIETLQANEPKFYTQGTCGFGISSLAPTTIMWAHLITAFETLNMFCVQNPIAKVKGGRAYYGKQSVSSWINGKAKRDSNVTNGDDAIPATEALPPGINATIFRHDPNTQISCEWVLAEEKKNLTNCRSG